jgi:membrane protein implicated in regulation of membrane protease activity
MFDLFAWWNAVYTVPLAFVLVVLTITSVLSLVGGGLGALSHGFGVHVDHDVDVDVDHDVHLEHDVDVDHDVDLDHDLDVDHDGEVSPVERAGAVSRGQIGAGGHGVVVSSLVALGVGRAPLVMLLQILLLFWGLIGLGMHQALHVQGPGALVWSIPLTLVLSVVGTRTFAQVFGRFFKTFETAVLKRDEIVGRSGTVVYDVTPEEGTVSVRDEHGTLHRVRARSSNGALASGKQIIVLGYDPAQNLYQVDDAESFVNRL